jgi:hypothetical protein
MWHIGNRKVLFSLILKGRGFTNESITAGDSCSIFIAVKQSESDNIFISNKMDISFE